MKKHKNLGQIINRYELKNLIGGIEKCVPNSWCALPCKGPYGRRCVTCYC